MYLRLRLHLRVCVYEAFPYPSLFGLKQFHNHRIVPRLFCALRNFNMAVSKGSLDAYMYVDAQSLEAYKTGVATWLNTEWHNNGIDNKLFSEKLVPFAMDSPGQRVALKKYARAHRARSVQGPPVCLLHVSLPASAALGHILCGDIKIMASGRPEETVGFAKPVDQINFPQLVGDYIPLNPAEGMGLLTAGLELLSTN